MTENQGKNKQKPAKNAGFLMRSRVEPQPPVQCTEVQRNAAQSGESVRSPVSETNNDSLNLTGDLRVIVDAWADLPEAVKAGIVAMVRASVKR